MTSHQNSLVKEENKAVIEIICGCSHHVDDKCNHKCHKEKVLVK